jgi:3-methyl-2-oxobutanoate hydroxymethyltransferase
MSTPPRPDHPDGAARRPITLTKLAEMRALGEPIVMVTAYDHPSAKVVEAAGVDIVLVGDSAANNVLGYADTVPVTVEELLMLAAAVRRGLRTPLLVGDLPFGSYEASNEQAIATAHRFVKEAGCDAVKVEGSAERARAIVKAGVPVMGHVGLTPQTATALGGYRAQGRTAERARAVLDEALELQEAGCFAIVFEAIPADVTDVIMGQMEVPVIGIGAGPSTDGQVLVLHDLLGIHGGEVRQALRRRPRRDAARARGIHGGGAHARVPGAAAHVRHRTGGAVTAEGAAAGSPARVNASFTTTLARHGSALQAVRSKGARVLRPVRGGRREHRASRRPARADRAGLARPR